MAKSYDPKIYNECKRLYVQENKSPAKISEEMGGTPAKQTITLWAKKKDRKGRTWADLRQEHRDKLYEEISPQNIALQILKRIRDLFDEGLDNQKTADALVKYQSMLTKLTNPEHQINTMYYMLKEMLSFLKRHYPDIVDKDFILAIQDFKNHLRSAITNETNF